MERITDVRLRRSASGVPHVVFDVDGTTYSTCFFFRTKKWKVWRDYGGDNEKIFSQVFENGDTKGLLDIIDGKFGPYTPFVEEG